MAGRGEVYLAMYGDDFDPDEVSAHIGLPATGGGEKESVDWVSNCR